MIVPVVGSCARHSAGRLTRQGPPANTNPCFETQDHQSISLDGVRPSMRLTICVVPGARLNTTCSAPPGNLEVDDT